VGKLCMHDQIACPVVTVLTETVERCLALNILDGHRTAISAH